MVTTRSHGRLEENGHVTDLTGGLESRSSLRDVVVLGACSSAGIVFGIALEKGRVFEPAVIQDQMLMKRFVMMKMFLSAVSSGMFCLSALSMIPSTQKRLMRVIGPVYQSGLRNKGVASAVIGAAVLGSGMTLAGACPGMVLAQVGSGTQNALYTFGGGLLGAALYGLVEPTITQLLKPRKPISCYSLQSYLQTPYSIISLPVASVFAIVVFGLELMVPWKSELSQVVIGSSSNFLSMQAWSPAIAGIIIGALQIPIVLLVGDTLGGSSSYCTLVSLPLVTRSLQKLSPYLTNFRSGIANWWQVCYIGGAIVGGGLSAQLSGTWGTVPGVSPALGMLGGFLMITGARIAGGCTSGHGLSGIGALQLLSFAAVPAMFAGAMGMAFALDKFGVI